MRKIIAAAVAALTLTSGVAASMATPVEAHSYCTVNQGYTGSTGSYANLRFWSNSNSHCYDIIRTMTRCTGAAGTIWLYGPWRGANGTDSTAYCSNTGGAYPTRIGKSYQLSYVNH